MTILSFSVRENHPRDSKILKWYNGLERSDRSKEIREILLSHIEGKEHIMISDESNQQSIVKPKTRPIELKMVNMVGGGENEEDLELKLEGFGDII